MINRHRNAESKNTICIVTPYPPATTETFIRGHIERLPAKIVVVHSWPPTIGNKPVLPFLTRFSYRLRRAVLKESPQIENNAAYVSAFSRHLPQAVLAEYGDVGVNVMEACAHLRIPLIVHFHGYDASVREVLEQNAFTYPKMFEQASALIAVSRAMESKLISLGADPRKVFYNPCGVDCDKFSRADPLHATPTFVAVGRFVEKKGPHLMLRAFALVHEQFSEATLRMLGDGPLLESSIELAKTLRIIDSVTFLGAQPHEVVCEEMRRARAFVQHSLEAANGDSEGTPVGIMEAGASGLPVVSTRHAGIPDVVIEGETGFLVDEGDIAGMAEKMIILAKDPQLAGRLGSAARGRVEDQFSQTVRDNRLWEIIMRSLSVLETSELR